MITELVCGVIRAIGFVDPRVSRGMQCNHGGHSVYRTLSTETLPDGARRDQVEVTTTTRYGVDAVTEFTLEIK